MTALRIGLALTGLLMTVEVVTGQVVPLETGVIGESPDHQPYDAAALSDGDGGAWQHAGSAGESYAPGHVGDMPLHEPQPVHQHLEDGWVEHGGHGGEPILHHGDLHLDHPIHSHEGVEVHEAPATCNCGDSEHCHGVCRDPGRPRKPKHEKPGDKNRGDCPPLRYRMDDCRRAGNPHCVARWAQCSVSDKYSSWFVGGGAAFFRGRCRTQSEGTWGLDYDGYFGHVNNWLKYTRGRKQGGEGAYRTDGEPKVVSRAHEILGLGH